MVKPVILTLDDEPQVLNAVGRDLRAHFRSDYRIISSGNGPEALEVLQQLQQRNTPVALFLVDQRMPEMTGTELLVAARQIFPEAKRVLLTAYSDTDVAIEAINQLRLDYYLVKPWHPPEEQLYPVLDDLLADWQAAYQPEFEGLRLIGSRWSPKTLALKDVVVAVFTELACHQHMVEMHHAQNPRIDLVDDSHAKGVWGLYYHLINTNARSVTQLGAYYEDEYRKVDDHWRISATVCKVNSTYVCDLSEHVARVLFAGIAVAGK